MVETAYDSEDVLQALIARFPDLLAGDQLPGDVPRRWLLVGRKAALPAEEDGAGRWSVDHLFLDQDAVPTLVEVKRSSDTRIRREVIGQMLDYAANAVLYWPIDALRSVFERRCEAEGRDMETELASAGTKIGTMVVGKLGNAHLNRSTELGQAVPQVTAGSGASVRTAAGAVVAKGRF